MHTHSKIGKLIWLSLVVVIVVVGFLLYKPQTVSSPADDTVDLAEQNVPVGKSGLAAYENYLYNFRFEYPTNLYMKETEFEGSVKLQLSIILVDGTKENIDVMENRVTDGREFPPSIIINIYQNDKKLSATDWAKQDINSNIGNKEIVVATVGGAPAVSYKWSGLYEGKTVVITKGEQVYVFHVMWLNPEDQLLKDFDIILNSFVFSQ